MTGESGDRWPRTDWLESVYSSDDLRPLERLTAAIYADHARDRDHAWVTLDRLIERSGMSRDAANRARRGLVNAGWLVPIGTPSRRKATKYRFAVPSLSSTRGEPLSSTRHGSLSGSGDGSLSSTPHDTSSPADVPEQSARRTRPKNSPQTPSIQRAREDDDSYQPPLLATVDGEAGLEHPVARRMWANADRLAEQDRSTA